MARFFLLSALLLVPVQDPDTPQGSGSWFGPIRMLDTETGEYVGDFSGFGNIDLAKEAGTFERAHVRYFTKPKKSEPTHTIHLFATKCTFEGVGRVGDRGKAKFHFSESLRVFLDDNVRLWSTEGTFDYHTLTLTCPKKTRLVHFEWPPQVDLASALVYLDPQEMEWLKLFGAPEPNFEFSGEEFVYDAGSDVFTAGKNGRIRVRGNLSDMLGRGDKKPSRRARPIEPTELRCEGPLQVRNLGASDPDAWNTLHVTADKNVVVERLAGGSTTRIHSDRASIYLSVPPSDQKGVAHPVSAVFVGRVKIEESRGLEATGDRLEWNRQDDLVRLSGPPRVEVTQGSQKLQARDVIIDRWRQTVDFKGEILATFAGDREALAQGKTSTLMTLKPAELQIRTDPSGRPVFVHAWNGVVLSSPAGSGQPPMNAEGREFEWNLAEGEGCFRGAPFATLEQGHNFVAGPLITFRGASFDRSLLVVKGPKVMRFFHEMDAPPNIGEELVGAAMGMPGFKRAPPGGEPTLHSSATLLEGALGLRGFQRIPGRDEAVMDLVITCTGDAVLDQAAHAVKLVDSCSVRAQDSTLTADRLFVHFTEDGRGLDRVIGVGRVRADQDRGPGGVPLQIEGETFELRQDPALGPNGQRVVRIVGHPWGRALQGSSVREFEWAEYNLSEKSFAVYNIKQR